MKGDDVQGFHLRIEALKSYSCNARQRINSFWLIKSQASLLRLYHKGERHLTKSKQKQI